MRWVTPRHLAGDDDALAERIGDTLTALGWRMWPTARDTLLYVSPDELRGAEWILASSPFTLGGLRVALQISARPDTASALVQWNAYFTTGVPHEALNDFLVALDASAVPDSGFAEPEAVVTALSAQGWIRDVDRPRTAATDPGFASHVSLEMLPDLIADADLREDLMGWQAWAEPTFGAPYLWCANFSPSVPHELVAVFASSLASPVPVARHRLPQSAEKRLTIVHRG
ncbi:DUF317 domain-containing protein [Streptomyces sp. G44]|uniref:DUF317 domain-containing protein n=1 Tax=Streptomyces sp. G44 TaxID=2807632 RepID=UPI0019608EDA|nr:DUF317 domain-containing protein [Streptomyces sp. G44]MBM7167087.1 DUF317 domain-containing protein [Streptomyces sp. G44]